MKGPRLLTLALAASLFSSTPAIAAQNDLSGHIETIAGLHSPQLGNNRDVLVYLPPSYASSQKRYPVLYMQDGQNVFNAATSYSKKEWGADETAEALAKKGLEVIIVAVNNMGVERIAEFGPYPHPEGKMVARGSQYAAFLVDTLKPLIDGRYRTLSDRIHTGVAGSSAGGNISLYAAVRYPQVFGFAGVLSPALHLVQSSMYTLVRENPNPALRVWVDVGTAETGLVFGAQWMADLLKGTGSDVRFTIEQGAGHDEAAWRVRFPQVLEWFLTAPKPRVAADAAKILERAADLLGPNIRKANGLLLTLQNTQYQYGPKGAQAGQAIDLALLADLKGGVIRSEMAAGGKTMLIQQGTRAGGWFWTGESGAQDVPIETNLGLVGNLASGPIGLRLGSSGRDYARYEGTVRLLDKSGQGVTVSTNGLTTLYVFAPDGNLLAERYPVPGGEPQTAIYSDYRTVNGGRFPFEITTYVDRTLLSRMKVREVKINPSFTTASFKKP